KQFVQDFFRDGHACFLLVKHEPDQSYTKDRTLSLRKAHRLAILAPTCLPGAIHIPLRFLKARTPDMIRNEAARYWKARGT
ncbi:hypothetical protein N5A93_13070, partial [Roseovarius sp. EGI FJ00037]|uniref:hypothetical protein n=1 Tax=Roseovarius salincola TaxID=2978479 RepID=UPI0022A8B5D3